MCLCVCCEMAEQSVPADGANLPAGPATKLSDIETFYGGSQVNHWLFQLEQHCQLRGLQEPAFRSDEYCLRYGASRLRGSAAIWWESVCRGHGGNPYRSYQEWASALAAACLPVDVGTVERRALAGLWQTGTVQAYIERFRELALGIPGFQYDGEGKARFIEHLKSNIRLHVELAKPQTLQEAMEAAQAAAAVLERGSNPFSPFAPRHSQYERPPEPSVQQQQRPTPMELGQMLCYVCHRPGHVAARCPSVKCSNCGRFGHMAKRCTAKFSHAGGDRAGASRGGPPRMRTH